MQNFNLDNFPAQGSVFSLDKVTRQGLTAFVTEAEGECRFISSVSLPTHLRAVRWNELMAGMHM